jgi:protein-ribulosamine 3-kinase
LNILTIVSDFLLKELFIQEPLTEITTISGGCINDCFRVSNQSNTFFLKVNVAAKFPGMFQQEAAGLELLRDTQTFRIPKVTALWEEQSHSFLVLEWLEKGVPVKTFGLDFGFLLAQLHENIATNFGLSHNNYISSLPQPNNPCKDWHTFFFENRLLPQLEISLQKGWATTSIFKYAENIAKVIESEFPKEDPAFLHGDLWSGNYMADDFGAPTLFDPAVYFGNREMEIAFMHLFGGFESSIFSNYDNYYPLQPDFNKRMEIHQLYPILVHANIFEGNYIPQALAILKKF